MSKKGGKQLLPFITNANLWRAVKYVLDIAKDSNEVAQDGLYKNVIDPFSAVFDSFYQGISLGGWLKQEKSRQTQKTLQNALGEFHQKILGSISGWEDLNKGGVIDICNKNKKLIAEVKNKFNTTKGNHKVVIYDDLKGQLRSNYEGFTAYYVEVIPKGRAVYNKPFTPPDNRTHKRRPTNNKIRVIDGKSFYAMATADDDALEKLYKALPVVVSDILGVNPGKIEADPLFLELFKKAF